jgi:hypothetical protein
VLEHWNDRGVHTGHRTTSFVNRVKIIFKQGKRKSSEPGDYPYPMDNTYNIEQDRTRKGIMNIEQPDFRDKFQLQRNILKTSAGQSYAKQVMPWAAGKANSAGYPISDLNITRNYVSEPAKYENEKQDKDYPAIRNTHLFNSYQKLDPQEKFAEQFKSEADLTDYQRPSVIRRPKPSFSPRLEFEQRNLLLHNADIMKLQGDILQKSG